MSAGWLGGRWTATEGSVIARHEWKGLSKMNHSLEDYVEKQKLEQEQSAKRTGQGALRRAQWQPMPGAFGDEEEESD